MQEHVRSAIKQVLLLLLVMWVIEVVNVVMSHRLSQWGIWPRTLPGLVGIPLSPWLHGGVWHLLANSVPYMVLGGLVALQGRRAFWEVTLLVVLFGGAAVWLVGRAASHVGASGLIFGYFGYLVARGWYERSMGALLVALLTIFLYGGLIWGVVPTRWYVSWEGHLCGLLAGVGVARLRGTRLEQRIVRV